MIRFACEPGAGGGGAPGETHLIRIAGMTCEHCARRVEQALLRRPGVQSARVDLAAQSASVTIDPARASLAGLHQAIVKSGYQPILEAAQ